MESDEQKQIKDKPDNIIRATFFCYPIHLKFGFKLGVSVGSISSFAFSENI